jgi:Family of unknown function (DUF6444)
MISELSLPPEVWEQPPSEAQAYIRALEARIIALEATVQHLQAAIHSLEATVHQLREQVQQNSRTSSRPLSSDPPRGALAQRQLWHTESGRIPLCRSHDDRGSIPHATILQCPELSGGSLRGSFAGGDRPFLDSNRPTTSKSSPSSPPSPLNGG